MHWSSFFIGVVVCAVAVAALAAFVVRQAILAVREFYEPEPDDEYTGAP